jgi:hypothetical protein
MTILATSFVGLSIGVESVAEMSEGAESVLFVLTMALARIGRATSSAAPCGSVAVATPDALDKLAVVLALHEAAGDREIKVETKLPRWLVNRAKRKGSGRGRKGARCSKGCRRSLSSLRLGPLLRPRPFCHASRAIPDNVAADRMGDPIWGS